MTYSELESEVASLGFNDTVDSESVFLAAAKRAICTLFADLPHESVLRLLLTPQTPRSRIPKIAVPAGEEITLPLSAGGFSFRTGGEGSFLVRDGGVTRTYTFSDTYYEYQGKAVSAGSITFSGENDYTVVDFCLFPAVSDRQNVPVLSEVRHLNMRTLTEDFGGFAGQVTSALGYPIPEITYGGDLLDVPAALSGEIAVHYYRTPDLPDPADSSDLDLEREEEHLLPLLTAAYLALEDEEARAATYFSLYRSGVDALKKRADSTRNLAYRDVLGWA